MCVTKFTIHRGIDLQDFDQKIVLSNYIIDFSSI